MQYGEASSRENKVGEPYNHARLLPTEFPGHSVWGRVWQSPKVRDEAKSLDDQGIC